MIDLDRYVTEMGATHQRFQNAMLEMMAAYGQTQTVVITLVRDVQQELHDLHECQRELRQLIMDQSGAIRELKARLPPTP